MVRTSPTNRVWLVPSEMFLTARLFFSPNGAPPKKACGTSGNGALANKPTLTMPFRYVWPSELDLMAELAGLSLSERWAGWHREPFTAESTSHVSVWTAG